MHFQRENLLLLFGITFLILALGLNSGCKGKEEQEEVEMAPLEKAPNIHERLAKLAPTEIIYDESLLNEEQKQVIEKFVLAAKQMDKIFWKQASHVGLAIKDKLEQSEDPADKEYFRYLKINFGPFDRLNENKPFIGTSPKPLGAGFYPADLTKEEFQAYINEHPEVKEQFEHLYTVIKRKNGELVSVPYNEEYREDLEAAAVYLKEAADITTNPSLKNYLLLRADGLLRNDYYESDVAWIDLKDNLVEIVIGPFEVYEDELMGLKAAHTGFVYINDLEEMEKIKGYLNFLDEMQKNLPVEQKYKDQEVGGLESPLNVVIEVFTAGETKAGIQTSAFVLPNDERVRAEKGTKKVFLKNMMEAKFNKSLIPISKRMLSEEDAEYVTFFGYFSEVILHEIAHALGINYVTLPDGTKTTLNVALKEHNSPLEESKATVASIYNVPLLVEKGWIPAEKEREIYTAYLAGMFRAMRFGVRSAHGLATLMEFNFMKEKGAFLYDEETEKYSLDMSKIKGAIEELTRTLLVIQGDGDYEKAAEFIARYGQMDELTKTALSKLGDIPVDIEPVFPY